MKRKKKQTRKMHYQQIVLILVLLFLILLLVSQLTHWDARFKSCCQRRLQKSLLLSLSDGQSLPYQVVTDFLRVTALSRPVQASIFYIAYTVKCSLSRPLVFCWNGGPGNSSMWLHLGSVGPKRVQEHNLVDNPNALLSSCDLVFVDPPGTGFSRALHCDPRVFFSHQFDGEIVAAFIASYLVQLGDISGRSVFLLGESYGGARACMVTQILQKEFGLFVKGLILVSPGLRNLKGKQDRAGDGNDLPYILSLPSQIAVAQYHRKLPEPLNQSPALVMDKSREFAFHQYNQVLFQGLRGANSSVKRTASKLSRLTGIPKSVWIAQSLRLSMVDFLSLLLSSPGHPMLVGQMDGRFSAPGVMTDPEHPRATDPYRASSYPLYISELHNYFLSDLHFPKDVLRSYIPTNTDAVSHWNYNHQLHGVMYEQGNVLPDLRLSMMRDPQLQVLLITGWYDLLVPCSFPMYLLAHGLSEAQWKTQVHSVSVPAGHMALMDPIAYLYLENVIEHFVCTTK
jgi:carboxypeptidase C (cathepsin A)